MNNTHKIPVWEKYTLTAEEAAAHFRIDEHKLRNLINENKNADYLLQNGNRVQIKRAKFEKFVDTLEAIQKNIKGCDTMSASESQKVYFLLTSYERRLRTLFVTC